MDICQAAKDYLKVAEQFQLGDLDTEAPHPHSQNLSALTQNRPRQAVQVLKDIDLEALEKMQVKLAPLQELAEAIEQTLLSGSRIFICGCGATGRLALALEVIAREQMIPREIRSRFIAFMAGGDTALIRSIENFEDHPEYGARQLDELGFTIGDLLISATEGGETPFVIGATERATELSTNPPWFLYCNADEQLEAVAERSKYVLQNPVIRKINLAVGPMAIAGSTRMQASTVLMSAIGLAIMHRQFPEHIPDSAKNFHDWVEELDFQFIADFAERETLLYRRGDRLLYETENYGITVLTDTTERSPTFSLPPFENTYSPYQPASYCYLHLPKAAYSSQAWEQLLKRHPRTLEWNAYKDLTGENYLWGYDISSKAQAHRLLKCESAKHIPFHIDRYQGNLCFLLEELRHNILINGQPLLFQHLLLKIILNTLSTVIMGRLGRYHGNLMTYVKPSNHKLIDRSIRYIQTLYTARTNGHTVSYEDVANLVFIHKESLGPEEPIVLSVLDALLSKHG